MKRIWIAIFLITLAVGLCVYEQYEVKEFCDKMEVLSKNEDLSGIKEYWRKANDRIYIFSSHDTLHTEPSSVFTTCEDADISPSAINSSSARRIMK